jgi:uncharacterized protein YjdB
MQDRFFTRALLPFALALIVAGCTNPLVISLAVSPTAQTLPVGQTVQFTAMGTYGHGANHPTSTQDETNLVTWSSSSPSVADISATGMAKAFVPGTTTITASINGFTGLVSATATLTVTGNSAGTGTISGISSLTVIPGSQTVAIPGDTTQFIAVGTSASGATADLSSQVEWKSASAQIATVVPNTGLATAVSQGSDTITAEYTNPNSGSTVTGTATFTVSGGSQEQFTAVTIVPSTEQISVSGQPAQLIALGTLGNNGLQEDVTNLPQTKWASSIQTIAAVTSGQATGNGLVSGKSAGQSTITVQLQNPDGSIVSNTATVTTTNTPTPEQILSLSIIPSSISVNNFQLTGQFLAIATYAAPPYVRDVTNSPGTTWISTEPEMFPVDTNSGGNPGASAGLVTAYASGSAVIVAEATDADGTIQSASATFSCPEVLPGPNVTNPSCYPGEPPAATLLETLTIYNEGLNTTNWEVTAPSATGTANVLHCGPGWTLNGGTGGSVCTATYPAGTKVVLTAPAGAGQFGGWSYNCTPSDASGNTTSPPPITANGPNYCVVTLSSSDTVGAIFN